MNELKEKIKRYNKAYREGKPLISDFEYDIMLDELKDNISIDEYNNFIIELFEEKGSIRHKYIIGSLDKIKADSDDVYKFIKDNSIKKIVTSAKLDGLSMTLQYIKGKFVQALTRGDGLFGENQTDKVSYIVPSNIPNFTGYIRGEIIISKDNFSELIKRYNYKNPRNAAVGIINEKDLNKDKLTYLNFIAYRILSSEKPIFEQLSELDKHGFDIPEIKTVEIGDFDIKNKLIEILNDLRTNYNYIVDGLVIHDINALHENVKIPKNTIAFKENSEGVLTKVIDVNFKMSKQGFYKPVAILEPIDIDGTTVQRATIYNYQYMKDNQIGKNAEVLILKSGEIIPKIVKVVTPSNNIQDISNCIHCNSELEMTGVELMCKNKNCKERIAMSVYDFVTACEVDGIQEQNLRNWNIFTFEDLLNFKPDPKYKNQTKLYDELNNKVFALSEEKLITKFNWNGVGERIINKLINEYTYETFKKQLIDKVYPTQFPSGISHKFYNKVVEEWDTNYSFLQKIINDERYMPKIKENINKIEDNILNDKSFCFTGTLSNNRKYYEDLVLSKGGIVASVSKNLTYLVVGESAGSKLDKAKKLNITILNEDEFNELINCRKKEDHM